MVPGDRRYVSCFAFPLGRVESRYSTGIDLHMILHYTVSLMRQEFIDDGRLFVGLGFGIGSQNEAENVMHGDFVNDSARLPQKLGRLVRGKVLACPPISAV